MYAVGLINMTPVNFGPSAAVAAAELAEDARHSMQQMVPIMTSITQPIMTIRTVTLSEKSKTT